MIKLILLLFPIFLSNVAIGQSTDELLQKADSAYFDHKQYETALNLYKEIKRQLKPTDRDYGYAVDKVARALFYLQQQNKENHTKSIDFSKQFIDLADKEGSHINPEILSKKYFMYKNIISGYFGLGQRVKAKPFQDTLYQAYKNKQLPEGIDNFYCFEKFVYNNQNVWGYEAFAQLGDKEAEGSFSKHVYYIYSRDSEGDDKNELFTLQTVKVHKLKGSEPDFVLTKRAKTNEQEVSGTIWKHTFNNPIDYEKLHNAVVEILKGGVQPDTKSVIQLKQ
jgi:hypothetical protein